MRLPSALSTTELANMLRISRRTLYRWISNRAFPHPSSYNNYDLEVLPQNIRQLLVVAPLLTRREAESKLKPAELKLLAEYRLPSNDLRYSEREVEELVEDLKTALTSEDMRAWLNVSVSTLDKLQKSGYLRSVSVGLRSLFLRRELPEELRACLGEPLLSTREVAEALGCAREDVHRTWGPKIRRRVNLGSAHKYLWRYPEHAVIALARRR